MKRSTFAKLWNFVQFQIGWFVLVLTAALGKPWPGILVLAALLSIHLRWFAVENEWRLLLILGLGGWCWESLIHGVGLLEYPGYSPEFVVAPIWMAGLWMNFASVLNHSLAWLKGQVFIAGLLGGVGGPLAFLAGEKLNAVTFSDPVWTTLVLMVGWAIITPLVMFLTDKLVEGNQVITGIAAGDQ